MCELLGYRGDDCHVIYRNICKVDGDEQGHCQKIRESIAALWKAFQPYADPDFVEKFRRCPDQHYWEMYLGWCLLDKSLKLSPTNGKGPDFCIHADGKKIWIEAVAPTAGQEGKTDSIPERIRSPDRCDTQDLPREKIILRFRTGLDDKENKFTAYVQNGQVGENDIKVIALSSGAIRGWPMGGPLPYILNTVFPIGTPTSGSGHNIGREYSFQQAVTKSNGSPVETLFFTDSTHSDISAVIYSDAHIENPSLPVGNDLLLIHNPFAATPLPEGILPCVREYWAEDEGERWAIRNRTR